MLYEIGVTCRGHKMIAGGTMTDQDFDNTESKYVPIKQICDDLTAFGFSYHWAPVPMMHPWRLKEGQARRNGKLLEGEVAIRKFWQASVKPKLSEDFYRRRNLRDESWVGEARRLCGFNGPDYKDRFMKVQIKKPATARGASQSIDSSPVHDHTCDDAASISTTASAGEVSCALKTGDDASTSCSLGQVVTALSNGTVAVRAVSEPTKVPQQGREDVAIANRFPQLAKNKGKVCVLDPMDDLDYEWVMKKRLKKEKRKREDRERKDAARRKSSEILPSRKMARKHAPSPSSASAPSSKHTKTPSTTDTATTAHISPATTQNRCEPPLQDKAQAELLQVLYSRSSVLNAQSLEQTVTLLQSGEAKVVGLLRAFQDKAVEQSKLPQFKRLLDTILSSFTVQY